MNRYQVGDRVSVVLTFRPRKTRTGVVTRLPMGDTPWYLVDIDDQPEGQGMHFTVDEILGQVAPENPTPAEMLNWLQA